MGCYKRILYYTNKHNEIIGVDANGNQTAFSGANVITGQGGGALQELKSCNNWHSKQCFVYFRLFRAPEMEKHDTGDILYIENRTTYKEQRIRRKTLNWSLNFKEIKIGDALLTGDFNK